MFRWKVVELDASCRLSKSQKLSIAHASKRTSMGAFDPLITYEKGTYIGQSLVCVLEQRDGKSADVRLQRPIPAVSLSLPVRDKADDATQTRSRAKRPSRAQPISS